MVETVIAKAPDQIPEVPVSLVGHTTPETIPVCVPFALAVYEVTGGVAGCGICQTTCSTG
jgi:hypothetical protein